LLRIQAGLAMAKKKRATKRDRKPKEQVAAEQPDRQAQPLATNGEETPRLDFPVVGIGASAGGLEAFIEFFDAMPSDSGMAFVAVQHLSPDRESLVAEILAKHTEMPVTQIEDGMPVEPDHAYIIRPGHTLTLKNGVFHLGPSLAERGRGRPVDDFFRSLAEEQRERSIAIILSGMGSNGTAGAEVIKAVGGLIIAQDPESAKFPSMPRHLMDSGNADFVLRPSEMPAVLRSFSSHPYVTGRAPIETAVQKEHKNLKEIITVLRARTRRDFSGYKKPTVLRRIQRRMSLSQVETLSEYAKFLRQNPPEVAALSDDLMIHVTGFFRDIEAWLVLRNEVIIPLVDEREAESTIRCWVSACSSGEEAYTLGMLLHEAAAAANKTFDIKVFATDTADRTLSRARAGVYPLGIEAEVDPHYLDRYFERDDAVYRVKKELREMVVFAPQNVIQDPPFSRLDICSCRNLLIYLEPELQRRVLALLHFGLREGGVLFLGTSETINGADDLFETINKKARIYRRVGPTRHGEIDFTFPHADGADGGPEHGAAARTKASVPHLTERLLLDAYTPPGVVIDRNSRVIYFHGDTSPFLTQPSGEPTRELLSLVREKVRGAVRTALHQAQLTNAPATSRDGFIETQEGRFRIEVNVAPLAQKLLSGHFLITFQKHEEKTVAVDASGMAAADAASLQEELKRVQDELQSTIEELQSSNEEMKASNEETMSINEELQSTNEELETSKEELQSLNEELTTVNAQLQTKMEELEATSNDLTSLLASTDIAVIFLDTRFCIRRFTPAIKDLLDAIASDIGRPISNLAKKFSDDDLLSDCQQVLDKLMPIQKEITSDSGRMFMRRILPYRTSDYRITGVVITFIDITDQKAAEDALRASEERFRLVIEGAPDFAMLLFDAEGKVITWNSGAERMLGWSASEAVGRHASMIYPPETGREQLRREMEQAAEFGRAADESWHVRKAGARLWGSGVLTAVRDANGELTGYVKVLRDETARKTAETDRAELLLREQAARRDAETAIRLKDQFLATLSHELRTPLSAILVWARMLRDDICNDDEWEEGLHVIERSAEAQRQLLDDLLDTSRIASGKLRLERTRTELLPIVRSAMDAIMPTAREKGVTIETDLAPDAEIVSADPNRLRQVASNLLTNAVKFTPSGGRVKVTLENLNHSVELRVSDSGQGIDPEFLPHVFTAFSQAESSTTRSFGGLGLGLAICKELVELHGGSIRAESGGVGQGATFIVRLPLAPLADPTTEPELSLEELPPLGTLLEVRVLLVEDEPQTRDALAKLLGKGGADVTSVSTAGAALEAFRSSPPHVIISDIALPEEDGYHLMQQVRSLEAEGNRSPTPAIALTAFAGPKDRRRARDAGYHQHLAKPVDPAVLVATVARLLEETGGRQGAD
jgi:two-component system CheB/CheR fusion protein